ncbi:MAG: RidA family protein [Hyphomicrobiales bacterium]|nr:RidA family protein [Hyphomicrobiales bacterium]
MSAKVSYLNPPSSGTPLGLYSQIARVQPGEMVYIAGQLAPGTFEEQFRAVFKAIGDILGDIGADYDSVAKFTTYLVHESDIEPFMELRKQVFPELFKGDAYPPNTLLILDRLVREEFLIEVEAVARIPG